jgi:hypothetical protein
MMKKKREAKGTKLFMVHYQLFQVLTAVFMKMQVLWYMTTLTVDKYLRTFQGLCRWRLLRLQRP